MSDSPTSGWSDPGPGGVDEGSGIGSDAADDRMEGVLWQVLAGTRGGPNRARILRELRERPRNANQLAERLDLDYKTVRHHLDVLAEKGLLRASGDDYGAVYLQTDALRRCWDTAEAIIDRVDD